MADSRGARKRPKKTREDTSHEKPTKEETAVAKYLRFQLPTKSTTFMQENVEYFTGSKAVDFLLESKWATNKKGSEALFTTRASVVAYMNRLMQKRMFYRAIKTVKRKREKDAKSKDSKQNEKESKKKEKDKDSKTKDKETKKKEADSDEKKASKQVKKKGEQDKEDEEDNETNEKETNEKETKKGKKKVVLSFADNQSFKDNLDAYVWVYDPIKPSHYILGFTLVIAAIGICIYPLWPPEIKIGTYYLSLVGAGFVGSILVLGVFRFILFSILWAITFGKLHFWLFPNLLEDVGIRESFQPVYTKEWRSGKKKDDQNKENKSDDSKNEDENNENQEEINEEKDIESKNEEESEKNESESEENSDSDKDADDNGKMDFEVIEKEEVSGVEE